MKELTINEKIELAKKGENLDILVHDPSSTVRLFVLDNKRDVDLDVLVKDKNVSVRCEVLLKKRKKDLKLLLEDEDAYIRKEAEKYLKESEIK